MTPAGRWETRCQEVLHGTLTDHLPAHVAALAFRNGLHCLRALFRQLPEQGYPLALQFPWLTVPLAEEFLPVWEIQQL